jgi:ubiquinone/menaquinone biosynthesis C-methylase UbiE
MERKVRLEEEFELASEEQAFKDYSYVTSMISINYNLIADELFNLGNFKKGLAIDIGTGLGDLAIAIGRRYPDLEIIGIDISQEAIKEAIKKLKSEKLNNVSFQLGDVHNFSFGDMTVDLAVSHGAIHHLKNLPRVFLEIYRILKPDALAYLTDLRRDAPDELVKEIAMSLPPSQAKAFVNSINASYTPEELRQVIAGLGIRNFDVSGQRFSRDTIIKNMAELRSISLRKVDYNKLSQTIIIRK